MSSTSQAVSRALVGQPLRSDRLDETLLPKRLALPVFCSDPLSSVAYATEQILLVLGLGGLALLHLTPWVALGGRRPAGDRRRLLPPDLPRLSERRRRLRGQPREPRRERLADRRLGAADRLRAHGRRLGRRRRRRDHQRGPGAAAARGRAVARLRRRAHGRQPARGQGVRARLRAARPTASSLASSCCSRSGSPGSPSATGSTAESAGYQLRAGRRHRRAARRLPGPARVRLRLHRADRGRGGLERRPGLRAAEEPQRGDDPGDHGRRSRSTMFAGITALAIAAARPHGRGPGEPDRAPGRRRAEDRAEPDRARGVRRRACRSTCCRGSPRRS